MSGSTDDTDPSDIGTMHDCPTDDPAAAPLMARFVRRWLAVGEPFDPDEAQLISIKSRGGVLVAAFTVDGDDPDGADEWGVHYRVLAP